MVRTSSSRSRDRCSSMRSCRSGSPKSSARRGRDWTPTAHVATLGESPRRGRRRRPGPHRHGRRFSSGDPPCCRTTSFRPKSRSDEAEARFPGPVALIDVHCAGCWVRDAGSNLFRIGSGNPPETCLICGHLVLVMRRADGQNTSCLQAESGVRSASLAACDAEGRGFESLQPLSEKPRCFRSRRSSRRSSRACHSAFSAACLVLVVISTVPPTASQTGGQPLFRDEDTFAAPALGALSRTSLLGRLIPRQAP